MSTTSPKADASARARTYADDVRAALADLPADEVGALVDGLAEHLLEPGEGTDHLIDEVPPPEFYAAELRASASYGAAPQATPRSRRPVPTTWARVLVVAATLGLVGLVAVAALFLRSPGTIERPRNPTGVNSATPATVLLPDVVALSEEEAVGRLEDLGLSVVVLRPTATPGTVPSGVVTETEPRANTAVSPGTEVLLIVSP